MNDRNDNWYTKSDAQRGREALGCLAFCAVALIVAGIIVGLISLLLG